MKRTLLLITTSLVCPSMNFAAHAQPNPKPTVGIFDETKLADVRSDFPALASKVLPQIAKDRHLTIIAKKTGLSWSSSPSAFLDVTNDVLTRIKVIAPKSVPIAKLTPTQKQSARTALRNLSKLNDAVSVGLSFEDYKTRLVDTKSAVEDALLDLPNATLKTKLADTLNSFNEAFDLWTKGLEEAETQKQKDEDEADTIRATLGDGTPAVTNMLVQQERDKMALARKQKLEAPVKAKMAEAQSSLKEAQRAFENAS